MGDIPHRPFFFMKISKATKKDIPRIAKQMQELFAYHKTLDNMYLIPELNSLEESLTNNLERDGFITLCNEDGFIRGRIIEGEKTQPYALILDLYIKESSRRNGFGNLFFEEFKKWAKENNIKSIELFVDIRNPKSMSFWGKQGFNAFEERQRFIID